jgi:hypothetical protein
MEKNLPTPEYELHFYTQKDREEGKIPLDIMWLLENYKEIKEVEYIQPFIIYDNYPFRLRGKGDGRHINILDLNKYFKEVKPNTTKNQLKEEINNMIDIGILPIHEEIITSTPEVFAPGEDFLAGASWISLMVQPEKLQIIGSYHGNIKCPGELRCYNRFSIIVLSSDFRGKGLCRPLATFTYQKLKEHFQVEFICLHVAAENKISACRCYAQAGMDAGFTPYLNQEKADDVNQCKIFDTNPYTNMILLSNDSNITINSVTHLC